MKKSTSIKIYLLTLLIIFLTSSVSILLLLYYMDPESNLSVAYSVMWTAAFLTITSILTLIIFFFKKIYYRWQILMTNLNASLRQWIFAAWYMIWVVIFNWMWVYNIKTAALLFVSLLFIELIFQTITD